MVIRQNASLKRYNSFKIKARTAYLARFQSEIALKRLLRQTPAPHLIIGGGSNILFTNDFPGTVLRNDIRGRRIIHATGDMVHVRVGAGERWHRFVLWAVENNLGGIENLALIPGTVGAAPIQNIGAYGVELKDVFVRARTIVRANFHFRGRRYHLGDILTVEKDDARFGYRDSIFKRELKDKVVISRVTVQLTRRNHQIRTEYGAIRTKLQAMGVSRPTIQDISRAVIQIRSEKLPDPKVIGNAGSFFKNPVVSGKTYRRIKAQYPGVPAYPLEGGQVKIPAGWLIDRAGWKGFRDGDAGCYPRQALVLVNYGQARGQDILRLARRIQKDVADKFGIRLSPEVNIL